MLLIRYKMEGNKRGLVSVLGFRVDRGRNSKYLIVNLNERSTYRFTFSKFPRTSRNAGDPREAKLRYAMLCYAVLRYAMSGYNIKYKKHSTA